MKYKVATIIVLSSLGGLSVIIAAWLKCRRKRLPEAAEWQRIGSVKELALFPFKSGAAHVLNIAHIDEIGLSAQGIYDRALIVFTADEHKLAWAGIYPRMLSIKTEILHDGVVRLCAPDATPLELNLNAIIAANGITMEKQMKGFRLPLVKCGALQDEWVSRVITETPNGLCLYVTMAPKLETSWWRSVQCEYMPIMALHDKSIADLNTRLAKQNVAHHQQFRGNLLIASEPHIAPYDEDKWRWLRVGDEVVMRYAAPCRRCILPNIDINTCQRNPDFEPLKTLKSYRLREHPKEPDMGIYFNITRPGVIREGDPVYVSYI